MEFNRHILDIPNEDIGTPTLQPTAVPTLGRPVDDLFKSLRRIKEVPKSISPEFNALKKKIEKLRRGKKQIKRAIKNRSALKNFSEEYKIEGIPDTLPSEFLELTRIEMTGILKKNPGTKVKMVLQCLMGHYNLAGELVQTEANFSSNNEINLEGTDVDELYDSMKEKILENFEKFEWEGSSWYFCQIVHLKLHSVVFEPLRATGYIELPGWVSVKKACINPKNNDNKCFLWCILIAINPNIIHPERIGLDLRSKENNLNVRGIEHPIKLHDIDKFEKQNSEISVNVYGFNKQEKFYSLRITKNEREKHVDLLYFTNETNKHYAVIKNFSRLMSSQISKNKKKMYFCKRCLNPFGSEELLRKHKKNCEDHEAVSLKMPEEGGVLQFKNYCRKIEFPFVIYADIESILLPIETCQPSEKGSYTIKRQKHDPCSFYYIIIFSNGISRSIERNYTGKNLSEKFLETLFRDVREIIKKHSDNPVPIEITEEEKIKYEKETNCYICDEKFTPENSKVKDHCHFSGKYRGAAHTTCNLKAKIPDFTPVYFHNLSGYDAHLFIKALGKTSGYIDCIPINEEKYISFTKYIRIDEKKYHKIRFLDSFKFMNTSLDKLSKNLSENQLNILSKYFPKKYLPLVRRKGVFPHDYLDSFEKLEETQLPPKEKFYSSLNKKDISDEDYEHAKKVWFIFRAKTLKDYLELYNKVDVLLLGDIFENFRKLCRKHFGLDPCWYFTTPGLAYDTMLKITKVKLELFSDVDMLLMIEKGIRGGVSMCSKRYSKANNKYMDKDYDENKPSRYLIYIDANSLYPWAMSQLLPVGGFKWMIKEELDGWEKIPCFLEVDLEYPEELHDLHNDFPSAPEHLKTEKVEKLIPNLNDKKNYVIHHEVLKTYLKLGLKIKKIHRGIKFEKNSLIKKYIDLNIELRKNAENNFEKDFFKLMMNSVFGKTIENLRNRVNIQLLNGADENRYKKLTAKPNYHHTTIFDENLVAVHMIKTIINYNKPVYLGMSILDISKIRMQETYYNYFKSKYGEKVRMCYTDTDSFILEIETEDIYKDISGDIDRMFDTSAYPKEHELHSQKNKKVIGMFKDELNGTIITEFVGLGAKLYAYKRLTPKIDDSGKLIYDEKKCKGVKSSVVENELEIKNYKDCLFTGMDYYKIMSVIRSRGHEIYTEDINKKALSSADDKRIILEDKINTLAHGHYKAKDYYK